MFMKLDENFIKTFRDHLLNVVESLKKELMAIRTSRPSPKLVEDIPVEIYDQKMAVKQLGSITIVPPREIDILVWDKTAVSAIAKAIENSSLGLTANTDGNIIRINLPILTEERKKEIIKIIKAEAEEHRIKIRSARDDANKTMKEAEKEGKINEDEFFKLKEKTQKEVDEANKKIEELVENKIKEVEI
jgi:ribosome recycling factor